MRTRVVLAALTLALAACPAGDDRGGGAADEGTPPVLAGVPIVPYSQLVDTAGTREAARATLSVGLPAESVAAFYRRRLAAEGWRIVGDVADSGGVDLYAERRGPPLWIHIRPGPSPNTTRYALIGAIGRARAQGDTAR